MIVPASCEWCTAKPKYSLDGVIWLCEKHALEALEISEPKLKKKDLIKTKKNGEVSDAD